MFVEMESIPSALNAKNNLNQFVLFSDGSKINVFYSNREKIDL